MFMCDEFNTLNNTKCSIILNLYYILMTRVTFFKALTFVPENRQSVLVDEANVYMNCDKNL